MCFTASPDFSQVMALHSSSEAWSLMKSLVHGCVKGASAAADHAPTIETSPQCSNV